MVRVEVTGIENLPTEGAALLVANHAGVLPIDALMLDRGPRQSPDRTLPACAGRPGVRDAWDQRDGPADRRATMACANDADLLLRNGELTAVWPEGFKGIGKPHRIVTACSGSGVVASSPPRSRTRHPSSRCRSSARRSTR